MGDFALELGPAGEYVADMVIRDDDVASDEGLRTAILLSLFTDRRAESDDALPAEDGDRRGWWADELAEAEGDRIGSRLWLLARATRRADVRRLAEGYAREALEWMLEDAVAESVDVVAEVSGHRLALAVSVRRPQSDPVTYRFEHVWDGEVARAV